jgi:hypothetical protein
MCTLHEASARKSRYLEVLVLSIVKRDRERERGRERERVRGTMRNCACICSDGSICIDLQRVQGALTVMLAACWLRGLFYHFLGRSFWTTPTNNSEQFLNVLEPA